MFVIALWSMNVPMLVPVITRVVMLVLVMVAHPIRLEVMSARRSRRVQIILQLEQCSSAIRKLISNPERIALACAFSKLGAQLGTHSSSSLAISAMKRAQHVAIKLCRHVLNTWFVAVGWFG